MQVTLSRPNGLHILMKANLKQLVEDKTLSIFADGLVLQAIEKIEPSTRASLTLAEAVHQTELPQINALLCALLALDAEVNAVLEEETLVWPLPAFLSYRANLPLSKYPLNLLRLPPLNHGGHYLLSSSDEDRHLVARMDIHPHLKVMGHVRIATVSPTQYPHRLLALEHRLDRQELDEEIIEAAIIAEEKEKSATFTEVERAELRRILNRLREATG